jgi:hypothetical protein
MDNQSNNGVHGMRLECLIHLGSMRDSGGELTDTRFDERTTRPKMGFALSYLSRGARELRPDSYRAESQ